MGALQLRKTASQKRSVMDFMASASGVEKQADRFVDEMKKKLTGEGMDKNRAHQVAVAGRKKLQDPYLSNPGKATPMGLAQRSAAVKQRFGEGHKAQGLVSSMAKAQGKSNRAAAVKGVKTMFGAAPAKAGRALSAAGKSISQFAGTNAGKATMLGVGAAGLGYGAYRLGKSKSEKGQRKSASVLDTVNAHHGVQAA